MTKPLLAPVWMAPVSLVPVSPVPISKGSRPLNRVRGGTTGTGRGGRPATAAAIEAMCSGVVPQHPPTTFTIPAAANSPSSPAVSSGVWS